MPLYSSLGDRARLCLKRKRLLFCNLVGKTYFSIPFAFEQVHLLLWLFQKCCLVCICGLRTAMQSEDGFRFIEHVLLHLKSKSQAKRNHHSPMTSVWRNGRLCLLLVEVHSIIRLGKNNLAVSIKTCAVGGCTIAALWDAEAGV